MAKISQELLDASAKASKKYGIPQSVILGFAGNETSYGTAGMGKSKNNVFGIGNKTYESVADSVEDFAKLVTGNKDSAQSKKYGEAVAGAKTDEEWVTAITNAGYNSVNKNYVSDTMAVIKSHNLDQYNSGDVNISNTSNSNGSSSSSSNTDLKWWGDVLVVICSLLVVVGGVFFLYLTVKNATGISLNPKKAMKKAITTLPEGVKE